MMALSGDRQSDVRRAFGDPQLSIAVHGKVMESFNVDIRQSGSLRNRAVVLSCMAGLCTAACTVGAAKGSSHMGGMLEFLTHPLRVTLWAVASGCGLGYAALTSFACERAVYDLELRRELWEIENHLAGELQEMIGIYKGQGLTEEEALIVTNIFSKKKRLFADLMMVEELGYSRLEPPTWQEALGNAALPAAIGYSLGLAAPLLPLVCALRRAHSSTLASTTATSSVVHMSIAAVAIGGAVVGLAQTQVFYGAYANRRIVLQAVVQSMASIGGAFVLGFTGSRYG